MLDKSRADKELARRICAAFISYQMGVSITTQYKKTPEDVGDLWYFARRFGRQVGEGEPGRLLQGFGTSGDRDYSIGGTARPQSNALQRNLVTVPGDLLQGHVTDCWCYGLFRNSYC
jgi:hypothetical protein